MAINDQWYMPHPPISGMETRPHPSIGLTVDAPIAPDPGASWPYGPFTSMPPRCAAVDSFGNTYGEAICPVHGGTRCPMPVSEPPRLHPADVEVIARRVAELLKATP